VTDVVGLEGPLARERLDWIARLYGEADAKYRDRAVLEHLFVSGPAGPALHAFAIDAGQPVGHVAVVPMRARLGPREIRCGKVEALFVAPSYRGRPVDGDPIAVRMRERLYALADENTVAPLHAYVLPQVRRVLELNAVHGGAQSLVAIIRPNAFPKARARVAATALRSAQTVARLPAMRAGLGAELRPAAASDVDLVAAAAPPPGRWTVLADDSWDWYRASPVVRVVAVAAARALVQLPGSSGGALRVVAFRADRAGLRPAVAVLTAAIRLARQTGAATVRFQPWHHDEALARAARLLGFVARDDFTVLSARDATVVRADHVVPTPLLHLGF
jgi:GNAT superfamily N-acetyltransferase